MRQDARRHLEDLLDREIETGRLLSATLAAERDALTGNAAAAVEQKAAEKIELLGILERLENERRTLCDLAGQRLAGNVGADESSVGKAAGERWRALLDLMAGCRRANEVNGYIIHVRQNQIRQLMEIVRGTVPVTYGPQGKTLGSALRALARA